MIFPVHNRAEEPREGGEAAAADSAGYVPVPRARGGRGRGRGGCAAAAHALPYHAARLPRLAARQAALTTPTPTLTTHHT